MPTCDALAALRWPWLARRRRASGTSAESGGVGATGWASRWTPQRGFGGAGWDKRGISSPWRRAVAPPSRCTAACATRRRATSGSVEALHERSIAGSRECVRGRRSVLVFVAPAHRLSRPALLWRRPKRPTTPAGTGVRPSMPSPAARSSCCRPYARAPGMGAFRRHRDASVLTISARAGGAVGAHRRSTGGAVLLAETHWRGDRLLLGTRQGKAVAAPAMPKVARAGQALRARCVVNAVRAVGGCARSWTATADCRRGRRWSRPARAYPMVTAE